MSSLTGLQITLKVLHPCIWGYYCAHFLDSSYTQPLSWSPVSSHHIRKRFALSTWRQPSREGQFFLPEGSGLGVQFCHTCRLFSRLLISVSLQLRWKLEVTAFREAGPQVIAALLSMAPVYSPIHPFWSQDKKACQAEAGRRGKVEGARWSVWVGFFVQWKRIAEEPIAPFSV